MKLLNKTKLWSAMPFLSGTLFPLGFAPFSLHWVGYLSPWLLLACLQGQTPEAAFKKSLWWGMGAYGVGVSWVYVCIHEHGGTPALLALFVTLLFVVFFSLLSGLFGYLLNKYFKEPTMARHLVAFPTLWISIELLRNYLLTGFPWLYVGYTQLETPLVGYATLFGVWGAGFAALLVVGLLHHTFSGSARRPYAKLLFLLIIFALGYQLDQIKWVRPSNITARVALVQGSVPQQVRWDDAYLKHTLDLYYDMTESLVKHNGPFDIIFWPESAIPLSLPYAEPYLAKVRKLLPSKTTLVTGVPVETLTQQHLNSIQAMGNGRGVYYKKHLVPFGEYVPLEKWLRGLIGFLDIPMSDFIPGPSLGEILKAPPLTLAPAICYEVAYPNSVREIVNLNKVDAIVTISNDAWFGKSLGPHQHQEMAQMRAIENGISVIRATNSGITSILYPDLKKHSIPQFEPISLIGEVPQMVGKTPWTQMGPWPFFSFIWGLLGLCLVQIRLRQRR